VREGLTLLERRGIPADFLRVRAFPFGPEVEEFLNGHEFSFVIEQNRDAQLKSLLTLETSVPKEKMRSVLVYGGFPLSARHVIDGILRGYDHPAGPAPVPAHDTLPDQEVSTIEVSVEH
jgi:2-oxoglutarate ferredoxin oxidoreductase subunit alpha